MMEHRHLLDYISEIHVERVFITFKMFNEMKGPNLSIFKKTSAGGSEVDNIIMEFNVQAPEDLHWKILE